MLDDGRFRGRIYGKPSVKDGKWIVTSYVPPEKRDLEGRSVWTESGSCYLLGAPAEPEAAAEEEEEGGSADALAFVTRAK